MGNYLLDTQNVKCVLFIILIILIFFIFCLKLGKPQKITVFFECPATKALPPLPPWAWAFRNMFP